MSTISFTEPRCISDALEIPKVGYSDDIQLLHGDRLDSAWLKSIGAYRGTTSWWVKRDSNLPLEKLNDYLPRYARRAVIPNVVDLIPSSSWFASLANMLLASSWEQLRAYSETRAGGCQECGVKSKLECHEAWRYDQHSGVQTLMDLMTLCKPCHETFHLGFAQVRDRYDIAFDRLTAINRIPLYERGAYQDLIFEKFHRRSQMKWVLDLTLIGKNGLQLKRAFSSEGGGFVSGDAGKGAMSVRLVGVIPTGPSGQLVLV